MAPEDHLLARDARRYAPASPLPRALVAAASTASGKIKRLHSMSLGLKGAWRAAAGSGDVFFAAGIVDSRIVLSRADSAGNVDRSATPWPKTSVPSDAKLILVADHFRRDLLGLYAVGEEPLPQKAVFNPSEYHPKVVLVGGIPGSGRPLGASLGGQGRVWTLEVRERIVAICTDDQGRLISTLRIPELSQQANELLLPLPMYVRNDCTSD